METAENLSETLFKPRLKFVETSLISNSGAPLVPFREEWRMRLDCEPDWYRPLHLFLWSYAGGKLPDMESALSRIASATGERSRPECLDTISNYGPGNWSYEFNLQGARRGSQGRELVEQAGKAAPEESARLKKLACHHFRMASRYFSIAAYPNLRGDMLAAESYLQAQRFFRLMYESLGPGEPCVAHVNFRTAKGETGGSLYLPVPRETLDEPLPCVILCGSYEHDLMTFFSTYRNLLMPLRLAALVVEMPGLGASEKLTLDYNSSVVVDAALDYLAELDCVDSTRVGLLGIRLGGTACLRSTILNPGRVKALALIEPCVHAFFSDPELLKSLPLCMRSLYANRLNFDAGKWDSLLAQMQVLSLKKQGLLVAGGQNPVPTMLWTPLDFMTRDEDVKALKAHLKSLDLHLLESYDKVSKSGRRHGDLTGFVYTALSKLCNFLGSHLKGAGGAS